ncbi:unnamed protein product [Brachionus calyciflorus]|uniref:F-box/LRR-repeat protein 15-like leucin rich repeat domain-containing protein n=1 Tax=Brachionus calyciflorus TaxID=104777 RepID=A0A814CD29_9BILA|nr:unnamed protein product [Brachionus calyciflorus]
MDNKLEFLNAEKSSAVFYVVKFKIDAKNKDGTIRWRCLHNLVNLVINNMHISLRKSLENLRSHKLNFVDLSFCSEVLDEDLWFLCKNNSNIQTLRLTHCTKLTNSGIGLALNMLKNLRNLDLEGIKDSGPYFYDLNSGFNPIKKLINISFCGSNSLDMTEMKDFFKSCPSIKELNIYYSNIGSNSIRMNLVKDNHPLLVLPQSLISLSLYRPIITDPNILINSLKRLENLKDLSLFCVECLDDNYFTELLKSIGNQLRSIKLGGYMSLNNQLGDQSIESIGQYCKNLENISFELFSLRADFKNLETLFLCTETSAKLKSVNFSACRAINRSLLVKFGLNCKNIIKLDFSGLDKIIDDDLISILALNLNQLEYIDLKACSNCTDNGIVALASNCPLKCLVLSGLYKLTDKSLYTMGNFLEKSLEELYLAGCLKLTQTAIIYLLTRCTNRLNFQPNVYKFNLQ